MLWKSFTRLACFTALLVISISNANSEFGSPSDIVILMSKKSNAFELQFESDGQPQISRDGLARLKQAESLSFCAAVASSDYPNLSDLSADRLYEKMIENTLKTVGGTYTKKLVQKPFAKCHFSSQSGTILLNGEEADIAIVQLRDIEKINYEQFWAVLGWDADEVRETLNEATLGTKNKTTGGEKRITIYVSSIFFKRLEKLDGTATITPKFEGALARERYCSFIDPEELDLDVRNGKMLTKYISKAAQNVESTFGANGLPIQNTWTERECLQHMAMQSIDPNYTAVSIAYIQNDLKQETVQKLSSLIEPAQYFDKHWFKVGEVTLADINKARATDERAHAELAASYEILANERDKEHIGSITVKIPNSGHLQFCGVAKTKAFNEPVSFLPELDVIETLVHSDVAEIVNTHTRRAGARKIRGILWFNSMEDVFQEWQLNSLSCNILVGYPEELQRFTIATQRIKSDIHFLLNPLWNIAEIYNKEASRRNYESVDQLFLQLHLNNSNDPNLIASNANIIQLSKFGVVSKASFESSLEQMQDAGYPGLNSIDSLLQFLTDLQSATEKGITLAQYQREKEKQRNKERIRHDAEGEQAQEKPKSDQIQSIANPKNVQCLTKPQRTIESYTLTMAKCIGIIGFLGEKANSPDALQWSSPRWYENAEVVDGICKYGGGHGLSAEDEASFARANISMSRPTLVKRYLDICNSMMQRAFN